MYCDIAGLPLQQKFDITAGIIEKLSLNNVNCIIYCRSSFQAQALNNKLQQYGIKAHYIASQEQMDRFFECSDTHQAEDSRILISSVPLFTKLQQKIICYDCIQNNPNLVIAASPQIRQQLQAKGQLVDYSSDQILQIANDYGQQKQVSKQSKQEGQIQQHGQVHSKATKRYVDVSEDKVQANPKKSEGKKSSKCKLILLLSVAAFIVFLKM